MIWLEGLYSETAHFVCSVLLVGLVAWRRTQGISLTWLRKEPLIGVGVIAFVFGVGGLLHLWLDSLQPWF